MSLPVDRLGFFIILISKLLIGVQLIIHRKKEYWNFVRPFKVYIDEYYLGSLANGETKLFTVPDGHRSLRIAQAVSFFRSQEYPLPEDSEPLLLLEVSTSRLGSSANLLLLFLLISIGVSGYSAWFTEFVTIFLLPFTLAYTSVAFFVFANRYIIVKPYQSRALRVS